MKVAVVHYWFITRRGGEKVVENILKLFPSADIYTLFYDVNTYGDHLKGHKVYSSKFDKSFFRRHYQKLFPLYPSAVASLKLKENYDLIISSESGPVKGICIPKKTPHICYIHSPMRYCWGFTNEYLQTLPAIMRPLAAIMFERLRKWDLTTVDNVSHYIANSRNVSNRVKKYYGKNTTIIYPPIANTLFEKPLPKRNDKDIYLSFGAITPYKRIDLLVETFNENGKKLVVIGDGSERSKLEQAAKDNISFLGTLTWKEIEKYLLRSRALLFPGEEDFGMIPLEVMAYGIPVLAYKKGGALETVIEKQEIELSTGMFFDKQEVASLNKCIESFEKVEKQFDPVWIRGHAWKFNQDRFLKEFMDFIVGFCK